MQLNFAHKTHFRTNHLENPSKLYREKQTKAFKYYQCQNVSFVKMATWGKVEPHLFYFFFKKNIFSLQNPSLPLFLTVTRERGYELFRSPARGCPLYNWCKIQSTLGDQLSSAEVAFVSKQPHASSGQFPLEYQFSVSRNETYVEGNKRDEAFRMNHLLHTDGKFKSLCPDITAQLK